MATLLQVAVTLVALAAFFAATLHIAASYLLPDASLRDALLVAPVVAAVVGGLQLADQGGVVILAGGVLVDVAGIAIVYELRPRTTIALAVLHVVLSLALGLALARTVGLLLG